MKRRGYPRNYKRTTCRRSSGSRECCSSFRCY